MWLMINKAVRVTYVKDMRFWVDANVTGASIIQHMISVLLRVAFSSIRQQAHES